DYYCYSGNDNTGVF
nr:immunoglobulin light chain junction region [Macaca mulatta]MOW27685.1 immunoglobulin light chain junction region [Macaca mulatta]